MRNIFSGVLSILYLIVFLSACSSDENLENKIDKNVSDLKNEISELKQETILVKKELLEIKQLIQTAIKGRVSPPVLKKGKVTIKNDPVLGEQEAKIVVVEFSEYECPYCGRFYKQSFPQIKKNYIDSGKVRYVFKDLPLSFHANAQKAAEAAHCAGEEYKFWPMHDILFENQKKLDIANLFIFAEQLALNKGEFKKCLDEGRYTKAIKEDARVGHAIGIRGTPSFVIGKMNDKGEVEGNIVRGAVSYEKFKTEIERVMGKA